MCTYKAKGVVVQGIYSCNLTGQLASVGDLTIDSSTSSFTTSWSAPFSLDVTNVDPDIWYTVLIYNVTDENPTTVPCIDCHNLTQTYYTFSPDHPSPCHQYTFTVIHSMELVRERAVIIFLDVSLCSSSHNEWLVGDPAEVVRPWLQFEHALGLYDFKFDLRV